MAKSKKNKKKPKIFKSNKLNKLNKNKFNRSIKRLNNYAKKYNSCIKRNCEDFSKLTSELEDELTLIKNRLNNKSSKIILNEYKKVIHNFNKSTNYKKIKKDCECKLCKKSFSKLHKLLIKENKENIELFEEIKKEIKPIATKEDNNTFHNIITLFKYLQKELKKSKC